MRQTGYRKGDDPLAPERFQELLRNTINKLDVKQARKTSPSGRASSFWTLQQESRLSRQPLEGAYGRICSRKVIKASLNHLLGCEAVPLAMPAEVVGFWPVLRLAGQKNPSSFEIR